MAVSYRRSIINVIISIALAIALAYAVSFALDLLASRYTVLKPYEIYIRDGVGAVIAIGVSVAVVRVVRHLIESYTSRTEGRRNLRGLFIIFRVIIYAVAITWFLAYIGVNIEGALVGGAIGGIVIGFAVQSIVSNLLSGLMVSGGGFITPGEPISIYSWMFGPNVTGLVEDVKTLYTRIRTPAGQTYLLPNTALLGSSVFTPLRDARGIRTTLDITVPGDVPANELMDEAKKLINSGMKDQGLEDCQLFLSAKNGTTNTILAILIFRNIDDLNRVSSYVNLMVDQTYWGIKSRK